MNFGDDEDNSLIVEPKCGEKSETSLTSTFRCEKDKFTYHVPV